MIQCTMIQCTIIQCANIQYEMIQCAMIHNKNLLFVKVGAAVMIYLNIKEEIQGLYWLPPPHH